MFFPPGIAWTIDKLWKKINHVHSKTWFWHKYQLLPDQNLHSLTTNLSNCSRSNMAGCSQQLERKRVWIVMFRTALPRDVPIPWQGNHSQKVCQPFIPCQFEGTLLFGTVLSMLTAKCKKQSTVLLLVGCENASVKWRNNETESEFSKVSLENTKQQLKREISSSGNWSLTCFLPSIAPLNPWGQNPVFQMLIHVLDFSHV